MEIVMTWVENKVFLRSAYIACIILMAGATIVSSCVTDFLYRISKLFSWASEHSASTTAWLRGMLDHFVASYEKCKH